MIRLYRKLVSQCQTINQINRLHICLENRLAPKEIVDLEWQVRGNEKQGKFSGLRRSLITTGRSLGFPRLIYRWLKRKLVNPELRRDSESRTALHWPDNAEFPQESLLWFERIRDWSLRSNKSFTESFTRKRLMPNVVLYEGSRSPGPRNLLICLTGKSFRMMVPVPTFLQHIHADEYDVMVLKDPSKNAYRTGLWGMGDDLWSVISFLESLIDRDRYRKVVSLGVSGGGFPAILLCLMLKLDKGIDIAGNDPLDGRWVHYGGDMKARLDELTSDQNYNPNILILYGADHQLDRDSAVSKAKCIPSQLLEIRSRLPDLKIEHNVLYPILAQSKLDGFLRRVIDPDSKGFDNPHPNNGVFLI